MNILFKVVLVVLVFLAVSSGVTKIALMQQDVDFFGAYGFNNSILVAYGVAQLIGGILMVMQKTRFVGAGVVAITFLISAIVLVMAGKIPVAIVTFVAIILSGAVMKKSMKKEVVDSI